MSFFDILKLALRNLREAKLRAALTMMGIIIGVAVLVTMVSFGLGLQHNLLTRFQALDLFNEIRVFGRSLSSLVADEAAQRGPQGADAQGRERQGRRGMGPEEAAARILDEAAIAEIAAIPGVAYVEPHVTFSAYVRANNRARARAVSGATVPNAAARFQPSAFLAGRMIAGPEANEAVVTERWARDFGYENPAEAVGQTLEFLAPPQSREGDDEEEAGMSFFGLPLEADGTDEDAASRLVARSFRISGVLKEERERNGIPLGNLGGQIYIAVEAARAWTREHRNPMSEVALRLARERGALGANEDAGFDGATVRVTDPVAQAEVRARLTELGFRSFSIVDQLEEIRTTFLIINSALGLLGGISLLVASFGIANTMIMSILERTREIGIMKAIGAEDREIKFIFFFEAGVIGCLGGIVGTLAAWGIAGLSNRLAFKFILQPRNAPYVDFFSIPPYLWLGAILFAIAVAIVAALYPASRAARIDPVKALRHD